LVKWTVIREKINLKLYLTTFTIIHQNLNVKKTIQLLEEHKGKYLCNSGQARFNIEYSKAPTIF